MALPKKPLSFAEQYSLKSIGTNAYETPYPPGKMGNPANIAYGGCALATACKAAYLSVPSGYHIYSMLGHYLGPAYTDRPLRARVRTIRQTRTFATRQVELSQQRDDGEDRVCLVAIADFQAKEPASLFTFSRPPTRSYSHYANLPTQKELHQKLVDDDKISQDLLDAHNKMFGLIAPIFDQRPCPEGIFAQNLTGMAKALPTTQDDLAITRKSTAEWYRSHEALASPADHMASLTFLMDAAIAFLPLSFSHMWFDDVGACSSLDFALRFFKSADELDMGKWHLKEMTASVASEARTYGESWMWDENGNAVACMNQQSIMRPPPGAKGKL